MSEMRNPIRARVAAAKPSAGEAQLPAPVPVAQVKDLAAQFAHELAKLSGELIEASDFKRAAEALLELAGGEAAGERLWFIADRELALGVGQYLPVQVAGLFQMADCLVSILEADVAIADTATVGLTLDVRQPRGSHLLPEISVVIVRRENLKPTLMDALLELEQRGKLPTVNVFVTGPSRTADIEKTVVIPAHGPKRLVVVLYG
jgi:L-lactate dehydrogenase complex protein LldG